MFTVGFICLAFGFTFTIKGSELVSPMLPSPAEQVTMITLEYYRVC